MKKKIDNKDFQLSPQQTQFEENHKFRQKSDNCLFSLRILDKTSLMYFG